MQYPLALPDAYHVAVEDAAKAENINIREMISEHRAAAIAFLDKTTSTPAGHGRLLIYDLGGGTLDLALVAANSSQIHGGIIGWGSEMVGGHDFELSVPLHSVPTLDLPQFPTSK